MSAIASQITSLTIVYSTIYSDADQRKHQSSASLAFVRGIHGGTVNSPHKWPVTRKMFPFDDVIMISEMLTHWGRVTHICVGKLTIISTDNGLSPERRQAIIWTKVQTSVKLSEPRYKFQWNFNRKSIVFIQENALENVVCEMAAILSRPQCVNWTWYIFIQEKAFENIICKMAGILSWPQCVKYSTCSKCSEI